jgi:hypothetical protein
MEQSSIFGVPDIPAYDLSGFFEVISIMHSYSAKFELLVHAQVILILCVARAVMI